MLRRSVCFLTLILALSWPSQTEEASARLLASFPAPERVETAALKGYLQILERRGVRLSDQGVRIESLDGSVIYADHQSEETFNPASVMKVAAGSERTAAPGSACRKVSNSST